jgi:hypothetical protein
VAIRPLTIKPHLMGRVPPATARVPPNALR